MKKRIIILLSLILSLSVHAMENNSSSGFFSSLRSLVPAWLIGQMSHESGIIKNMRASKNEFEVQLQVNKWSTKYMLSITGGLFLMSDIDADPVMFLKYCYYQNLHECLICTSIEWLDTPDALRDKCKKAQIDGYSSLGAAILAQAVPDKEKGSFIQKLKNYGFELTEKDKELVVLEFYDSIPTEHKEIMTSLLSASGQSGLYILPYDVRRCIVWYMAATFKELHKSVTDMGKPMPDSIADQIYNMNLAFAY